MTRRIGLFRRRPAFRRFRWIGQLRPAGHHTCTHSVYLEREEESVSIALAWTGRVHTYVHPAVRPAATAGRPARLEASMPTRLPPTRSSCRALGRRRWPSIAPRRQLPDFLGRTRARAGWLVASQVGRCLRRRTPLPSSSSAGRKPKPLGSRSRTFSSRWARVLPHQAVRCWYRAYSPAPTISRRCVAGRVPPESRSESPRHAYVRRSRQRHFDSSPTEEFDLRRISIDQRFD